MEIRHRPISADFYVVTERGAYLERMSKSKFGERTPQIKEVENNKGTIISIERKTRRSFRPERQTGARCARVLSGGN